MDGVCYTRGETVDMTEEFREAEERVAQGTRDYLQQLWEPEA